MLAGVRLSRIDKQALNSCRFNRLFHGRASGYRGLPEITQTSLQIVMASGRLRMPDGTIWLTYCL